MKSRSLSRFRSLFDSLRSHWRQERSESIGVGRLRTDSQPAQPWVPRVRTLEPRIVLNATAELGVLGDLVLSGDAADDALDVTLNGAGQIEIFDASATVVPIRIGTDMMGNPITVDSLDPNQITSGRLRADLGGGNDSLRVDVPVGLNVTVVDGAGNDSLDISLNADASGESANQLDLAAEDIHIDGGGDDIDLAASQLLATGPGAQITIDDARSVRLGEVAVAEGALRVGAVGDPLQGEVSQAAGTSVSASHLWVSAEGDVDLSDDANSIVTVDRVHSAGSIDLHSDVSGQPDATMTVHDMVTTSGALQGDINVDVDGSVDLVSSDLSNDNVLVTENGQISVTASGDIQVMDFVAANDADDVATSHEIIAGGDNGRLMMSAGNEWVAGDSVQIHASQTTDGAVRLDASSFVIGDDFEINTGDGVGIARRFAPRPELDVVPPSGIEPVYPGLITDPTDPNYVKIETAFYDVESIQTDTLTQANENDATGVLSIDIGAAGENGLTLSIDWGGPANRFERIENLAGDSTRVDVSHVYLESDILNSTLNGRPSATDPLAVRFAVSHHDSIVLTGDSIVQTVPPDQVVTAGGPTLQDSVPGGVLTSTDNPLTPQLESGRAFFVIPRVNVPLAFLPVRDVIPDPVEPATPVILTSSVQLNQVMVDAVESSASPPSIRDEYFQLRVLSPDPDGDDLVDPIRLPDSILAEDRLDELFSELPDGAYEIDYVIGESDQRVILRVDLRNGKAIISDDDVGGAPLKLDMLEIHNELEPIEVEMLPATEAEHESR
ncbi:DUF342 domain-containing protein [Allorhodopirellula solitaria]|uniref:Uncharacterized protein n=1 Tax=Allorhodopirellula solitaria TaxID=2527987 RepID=A0A5C5XR90_9BACT|nr:DUF342 domain-containing protein [Allorhodopirellula solitaria]TWT64575.1 hypothetical protein CA85_37080 [Allorhodopirellula solitaria]